MLCCLISYLDADWAIFSFLRAPDVEATSPDRSALSLTRFYNSNSNRKTSTRSAPVESSREKRGSRDSVGISDRREPGVLRKPSSPTTTGGGSLKSDRSILEQIGVPDHKGWMRKRGDRYNTWTSRYFVLKGPHLYWLKSSNASVRVGCIMLGHACGIYSRRV